MKCFALLVTADEAAKKAIAEANARRRKLWDAKVEAGKKRAKVLSDRFARWYYAIPAEAYKKLRVIRKDLAGPKPKE